MINIDQLRISDDGKSMFIDAHVNAAEYFKDVYIDKVVIATEEQVTGSCEDVVGDNYIYEAKVSAAETVTPVAKKPVVVSGEKLTELQQDNGGWRLLLQDDAARIGFSFSGRYPVLEEGGSAKLVVANAEYDPSDGLVSDNILFTVDGKLIAKDYNTGTPIWQFGGKGATGGYKNLYFHIFRVDTDESIEHVRLDDTDNEEFLHFIYHTFTETKSESRREVHLVLNTAMMNTNFTESTFSGHMYFVFFKAGGTPAANTPCRLDEMTTVGVTFDYGLIYQNGLCYTRQLAEDCSVPDDFVNFILNYAALHVAIETEHYTTAIEHFRYLLRHGCGKAMKAGATARPCGCGK